MRPLQIETGIKHDILKGRLKAKGTNAEKELTSWGGADGHVGGHGPPKKGGRKNCRFISRSFPKGISKR